MGMTPSLKASPDKIALTDNAATFSAELYQNFLGKPYRSQPNQINGDI